MSKPRKMNENEVLSQLTNLILNRGLSKEEREALVLCKKKFEEGGFFLQNVQFLNDQLALLAIQQKLSKATLAFYAELSRTQPVVGASSLWNGMIK